MKFAIRDDDTNYFTKPQDLIYSYSCVWDICPISLSVVPFHACTKSGAIPKKYWKGNSIFPIGENKELVEFLKKMIKKDKISISLHGYNHKDNLEGYEFETGIDLYSKVKRGKDYLEMLFETKIMTFIPPHNTISKDGMRSVISNGLNLVNMPSFRFGRRPFRIANFTNFAKIRFFRWTHKNGKYPHVVNFGDHKEVGYYTLTPQVSLKSLKRDFDFCRKMGGSFILATHYWEFTAKQNYNQNLQMGKVFCDFWKYVGNLDDINFVTVNQMFEV